MQLRTVLVEPKLEENIGAVARVLKNFGFSEFFLVNPAPTNPRAGEKAVAVASHAHDVLTGCEVVGTVQEAVAGSAAVVGTTSKHGVSPNKHLRMPFFSLRELREKVEGFGSGGVLSVLFGREDTGLRNEELGLCDLVVCIPTSPDYPAMNLSHAVAVLLYELSWARERGGEVSPAGASELATTAAKEQLFAHARSFFDEIGYKEHKKEKTLLLLRRILGRAGLTAREVQTLRGILRKAEWKIGEVGEVGEVR